MSVVHLLVNPRAGDETTGGPVDALRGAGATVDIHAPASADEVSDLVRSLVDGGCDRLVVAGGDGLIHLAVQHVAGTQTVLGILPVGTGNDFARALGIPTDLAVAARVAVGDAVMALDALRVGEKWAASVATLGFSADVNERANAMGRPRGASRYTVATVLELPRLRARPVSLRLDGRTVDVDATLVTVANTSDFGGGMKISPGADPADGRAEVTVVGAVGRLQLLWFFRKVFSGTHLSHPAVQSHAATTVEIDTPELSVWADGEPVATTPTTITVAPGALRVAGTLPG